MNFLKQIDFCFSIAGLNYKGNHRYQSWIGGLLSILIFFIFTGITTYYVVQFFDRTTPKMAFQNIKYWTAPEYNLSNNFNLAIMLEINNINFKQLSHKNVLKNNNIEIQKTDLLVDTSLHVKKKTMKYPLKEQKIFSYTQLIYYMLFQHFQCRKCMNWNNNLLKLELIYHKLFDFQDLTNVYKRIQEIEVLRYILLEEKQLDLYNTIPKPLVSFYHNKNAYTYTIKSIPNEDSKDIKSMSVMTLLVTGY